MFIVINILCLDVKCVFQTDEIIFGQNYAIRYRIKIKAELLFYQKRRHAS